ncbi:MAG: cytochrome C oxidase subunit IV family protein [Bacteroidia bacterium]|nr:cytochrome C oxidase subunit IV family protein [Bacteroidia bacterium]
MESNKEEGVVIPDMENDYHGHPNYEKVLIQLFVLFAVSLAVGYFSSMLSIIIIFGTAFWKIAMVMRNFMHLKFEPWVIGVAVAMVIFTLLTFFFGVMPDVTYIIRDVVPKYN